MYVLDSHYNIPVAYDFMRITVKNSQEHCFFIEQPYEYEIGEPLLTASFLYYQFKLKTIRVYNYHHKYRKHANIQIFSS